MKIAGPRSPVPARGVAAVGQFALVAIVGLAALPSNAVAAAPPPQVAVLTMTPGPRVFERFGHTALLVGDRVYNFGTFDGADPALVTKFLHHTLAYWLSTGTFADHLEHYADRTITIQELSLDGGAALALAARLEDNATPAHRAYLYDFFLDNCATRVRDAVDTASGGALADTHRMPGRASFRGHVESVLGETPLFGAGVSLLLSASTDGPTTRWQDAFLPRELQAILAGARKSDGTPLVSRTLVIAGKDARPGATQPGSAGSDDSDDGEGRTRRRWLVAMSPLFLLLLPLLVGAAAFFAPRQRRARWRQVVAGLALVAWGLALGFLGLCVDVAALTPIPCAHGNASALLLHPGLFLLALAGLSLARGKRRFIVAARAILLASLALLLADALLHLAGLARQHHLGVLLSVFVVEALALVGLAGHAPAPAP